jgi:hypothetical protein
VRIHFWKLGRLQQRTFISDMLRFSGASVNKTPSFISLQLRTGELLKLCRKSWCSVLGISTKRLYTIAAAYSQRFYSLHVFLLIDRRRSDYRFRAVAANRFYIAKQRILLKEEVTSYIIDWVVPACSTRVGSTQLCHINGHEYIYYPDCYTKQRYYLEFLQKTNRVQNETQWSTFVKTWRSTFPHIINARHHSQPVCTTCDTLMQEKLRAPDPLVEREIDQMIKEHNSLQMGERLSSRESMRQSQVVITLIYF